MVRFNGPLFFANASFLDEAITSRLLSKKRLKHIVLVAKGINDMDASGEEALGLVVERCRSRGVDISLAGVNDTVMAIMDRSGLLDKIGRDHIYTNMEKALCTVHAGAHCGSDEARCPLTTACQLPRGRQRGSHVPTLMPRQELPGMDDRRIPSQHTRCKR